MLLKKHMKLIKKAYEMNLKNAVQDIINAPVSDIGKNFKTQKPNDVLTHKLFDVVLS